MLNYLPFSYALPLDLKCMLSKKNTLSLSCDTFFQFSAKLISNSRLLIAISSAAWERGLKSIQYTYFMRVKLS